jgi:hypothetical protein
MGDAEDPRQSRPIVMQMASHATHHFGQVVTLLRQLGYAPEKMDSTDLIRYLLRRYPQKNQKEWLRAALDRDATPLKTSDAAEGTMPNKASRPTPAGVVVSRRGSTPAVGQTKGKTECDS